MNRRNESGLRPLRPPPVLNSDTRDYLDRWAERNREIDATLRRQIQADLWRDIVRGVGATLALACVLCIVVALMSWGAP